VPKCISITFVWDPKKFCPNYLGIFCFWTHSTFTIWYLSWVMASPQMCSCLHFFSDNSNFYFQWTLIASNKVYVPKNIQNTVYGVQRRFTKGTLVYLFLNLLHFDDQSLTVLSFALLFRQLYFLLSMGTYSIQ